MIVRHHSPLTIDYSQLTITMPIILSLTKTNNELWAAGPEGLFKVNGHGLEPVPQPQQELACCASDGKRILVGGLPHGTAFSLDAGSNWQACIA